MLLAANVDFDIGSGIPNMPALEYLLAENNAFAISAELIIKFEAIFAGIGATEVVQLVDVLVDVFSKFTILLDKLCNDAAYEGRSESLEDDKVDAKFGDIPGLKPVSILFAAARLSKLVEPNGSCILGELRPNAILVSISKPVGYDGGRDGVVDFDGFAVDDNTGIFSGGVSNLCGETGPIADDTLIGGTPGGLLTICCKVLTDGKLDDED